MALTSETLIRSKSKPEAYERALGEVIDLDRHIFSYEQVSDYDPNALFRDPRDADNVLVLIRERGENIGYAFAKLVEVELSGETIRVCQPLLALLPSHVGSNRAMGIALQNALRMLWRYGSPMYIATFVINPGLYRGLATLFDNLYPGPNYKLGRDSIEREVLDAAVKCWAMERAPGCEQARHFIAQDVAVTNRRPFEPRCPEDHFFKAANPHYQTGHYLGICARMTWRSAFQAIFRELIRLKLGHGGRRGVSERPTHGDCRLGTHAP